MAENAISQLNTLTQSHRAQPPVYTERPGGSAAGQQFAFGVSVCVGKARLTGTGYGSTKRDAKLAAAENVLSKYRTMAHDGRIHTHPWSPPSPSQHSEPHSSPDYTPASPIPAHVYAPASPEFSPSYCPTSPPYAPVPVPTDFQFQAIHSALESLNQRVSALEHELANVRLQLLAASSTPAPPAPKQQRQEMTLDSRILEDLTAHPNSDATEIASRLSENRQAVNSKLYNDLSSQGLVMHDGAKKKKWRLARTR